MCFDFNSGNEVEKWGKRRKARRLGADGKGKTGFEAGFYIAFGRVRDWDWKCMEVPVCGGEIRRRRLCAVLSVLFGDNGTSRNDDGVCSGTRQQEKCNS